MTRDDTIDMMLGAAVLMVAYMLIKQRKKQVNTDPSIVTGIDPATIVDTSGIGPYGNAFDFSNLFDGVF
jgi:putative effector of murein hydrolase